MLLLPIDVRPVAARRLVELILGAESLRSARSISRVSRAATHGNLLKLEVPFLGAPTLRILVIMFWGS